jgi:surface polysaccharide O-acyltransferase-like enzyme
MMDKSHRGNRDSNMELLRIISMVLVMVVHALILIPLPTKSACQDAPISSIIYYGVDSISIVCVDLFVLLSGWYGIRFNLQKVYALLFQVVFFSLIVYSCVSCFENNTESMLENASTIFMLNHGDYWFIKAYLGLYILSPALNAFIQKANKRDLRIFLISFYAFQTVYGWLSINGASWLAGGYSAMSFVGLYILSSYIRRYGVEAKYMKHFHAMGTFGFWLACGLLIAILITSVAFIVTLMGMSIAGRLFTYTNPLVIAEALCFLLAFSKLRIKSRAVNWIAVSCLAVYLLHGHELVLRPYYGSMIYSWYLNSNIQNFIFNLLCLILGIFCTAIIMDKLRLYLWKCITGGRL